MTVPEELAAMILEREFPDATIRDLTDVSGGQKTTVVATLDDREIVIAVCDVPDFADRCALEPAVMEHVARGSDVPVPRVLASDATHCPPYYVAERIDGTDPGPGYASLPRVERESLIEHAARTLGRLHRDLSFDAPGRLRRDDTGVAVVGADSWPTVLASAMRGWIDDLRNTRFADLASTYAAAADRIGGLDIDPPNALLHFDYRPANLLVRDGAVVAVVDWGLARVGDPAYDLFKAEKNFLLAHFEAPSVRDALREPFFRGYEAISERPPDWRERRAYYRVAYKLESMRSFDRWMDGATEAERVTMAERLRAELADDLSHPAWDNLQA